MASGVFQVDVTTKSYTAQAGYTAYLYWSETSTGINGSTPYSVVSLTMKMKRLYSWAAAFNTGTGFAYNFKIDGTSNATGNVTYNSQTWTVGSEVTLWSKSVTINHNSDGSKTAAFRFEVTDTVLSDFTISGNAVLTNIPMASTLSLSASSVNLATSASITANISRYSTAYYHRLVWKIGSTTVATINAGQVASYAYTLTAADWLTKMTSSASASCSCTLTTYSNSNYSTQIGSASTATFTLNCTANPTASLTSAPRGTAYNHGLTSYYYSGYSTALLTASGSGVSGSTITRYAFYQGSSLIQSGTGTTKTTGALSGTSAITFKVIVTDSRGRTGQATVTVTPIAYSAPSLTVNDCFRSNSSGTASSSGTYIRVRATATANATGNSITALTVSTTSSGGTAVETNVALTSGTAKTLSSSAYATTTTYNVTFSATDKMGKTVTVTKTVAATVVPAINVRNGGGGVGIGMYAETNGWLDLGYEQRAVSKPYHQHNTTVNGASTPIYHFTDAPTEGAEYGRIYLAFVNYGGRLVFRQFSGTENARTSYYENYILPETDSNRTSNATYDILTTKQAPVYITESSISTTTGTWSYRKYSDGSCDLWGVFSVTPTTSTATASGCYYSDILYVTTPFALSAGTISGAVDNLHWITNPSIATSTSRIAFRLMRGSAITTGSAVSVRLSVHGVF